MSTSDGRKITLEERKEMIDRRKALLASGELKHNHSIVRFDTALVQEVLDQSDISYFTVTQGANEDKQGVSILEAYNASNELLPTALELGGACPPPPCP